MTPTQLARDALAGQMTPCDALVRIAGMEAPGMEAHQTNNGAWSSGGWQTIASGWNPTGTAHTDSTPAITDEVVERCWHAYTTSRGSDLNAIRAALEEFVRQTRPLTHPQEIRRATEQAAREAAMAAVRPKCKYCETNHEQYGGCPAGRIDYDTRAAVYTQTADREAGGVAWGCGEPFDPWWTPEKQAGWREAQEQDHAWRRDVKSQGERV